MLHRGSDYYHSSQNQRNLRCRQMTLAVKIELKVECNVKKICRIMRIFRVFCQYVMCIKVSG